MISLEHEFIFIHINKNGGTSFEVALRPFETLPPIANNHDPAFLIRQKIGAERFDRMESFAVVRNPFDRFVSSYEYRRQFLSPEHAPDDAIPPDMSFDDFLTHWVTARPRNRELGPQHWFLTDPPGGDIVVKHIYEFEDGLDKTLASIKERCGLPDGIELPEKKVNQTRRRPWQEYYRGKPELIDIVAQRCDTDRNLGYDLAPF
ncbi:MAG: sulfotransferase family 2 domain-containing protein [Verrucomicrobiales bacterium]|nr:sulfotransferase family 2 domain-containing protein [Verrucomicrobiales bacterium]